MKTHLRLLATLSFVLLLTACQFLETIRKNDMPSFTNTPDTSEMLLTKARQETNPKIANQYRLIAADKLLKQKDLTKAQSALKSIQNDQLSNTQQIIAGMLNAELAVAHNDASTAQTLLSGPEFNQLDSQDVSLQTRVRMLKADVFEIDRKPLQALRERSYISSFLKGKTAIDNQNNIWRLAMSLPLEDLQNIQDGGETGGWLELAKAVKNASTIKQQQANIDQWLKNNPNHSAAINPPEEIVKIKALTVREASKIAILLPQKEKYAQAIYNGFLAAYYQSGDKKTSIKLYESTDYKTMDAFYDKALQDGIELVIGPIEKNLVNELSRRKQLPITTLALNYSDTPTNHPPQLFQFGLLPEDEAQEAALKAWNDGRRYAVAIVPQGDWGKKVLAAFRTQWEQLGGVLEGIQYIDQPVDLDKQIISLLQKLPGKAAKSTNEDDNLLFMVANPLIARQIRALMIYRDYNKMPVYATTHIYAGIPDSIQDNDLNGVLFTETPWLLKSDDPLQQKIMEQWPQARSSFARLYAMGVDTWRLAPRLSELKSLPSSNIEGLSGQLSINSLQRVQRKLPWGIFVKGFVQPAPIATNNQ